MKTSTAVKLTFIFTIIPYILFFQYLDKPITLWIYQHDLSPTLLAVGRILGIVFNPKIIAVIGVILLLIGLSIYRKHRHKAYPYLLIGGSTTIAAIVTEILKFILARYRPIELIQHNLYGFHWFSTQGNLHSSPSGHATLSFTFFIAITMWLSHHKNTLWIRWLCILIALLVSISRVIVLEHYCGDIILGAGIGIITCQIVNHYVNPLKP